MNLFFVLMQTPEHLLLQLSTLSPPTLMTNRRVRSNWSTEKNMLLRPILVPLIQTSWPLFIIIIVGLEIVANAKICLVLESWVVTVYPSLQPTLMSQRLLQHTFVVGHWNLILKSRSLSSHGIRWYMQWRHEESSVEATRTNFSPSMQEILQKLIYKLCTSTRFAPLPCWPCLVCQEIFGDKLQWLQAQDWCHCCMDT